MLAALQKNSKLNKQTNKQTNKRHVIKFARWQHPAKGCEAKFVLTDTTVVNITAVYQQTRIDGSAGRAGRTKKDRHWPGATITDKQAKLVKTLVQIHVSVPVCPYVLVLVYAHVKEN